MGASFGCGCFEGLHASAGRFTPDVPRDRLQLPRQISYEEALNINRPQEGTWTPTWTPASPKYGHQSPKARNGSADWATPARKNTAMSSLELDSGVEFDLDMEEFDSPKLQIDHDAVCRRASGFSKPRTRSQFECEQLLASPGSLPRPMNSEEREAAIRTLLPTATYQMLAKVPTDLISKSSPEVQQLRRKLARGATVVFVSAGLPGKRFIYERAAELGVKSVIIDHVDSWSKCLVEEGVIAKFIPVDMTKSSLEVFEQCLLAIRGLSGDKTTGSVDAITTFIELSVPLVSRLCEALGLPGLKPSAVDAARDKYKTRACLKANGLPTPKNALIRGEDEVDAAGRLVGFPAVLKPPGGAASLGVKKVESMDTLKSVYAEVVAELRSLVVSSGALIKGGGDVGGVDASNHVDTTVLMEQYLDGCEVDIDVVMSNGQWQYAAVADNGPTLEPYFNETWAVCPSLLPKEQQQALKDLAIGSVEALGFVSGVFHVECKFTSSGPQLIEVNARMGGGQVRECNLRTWGVDLVEETLFIALGIPARPCLPKAPLESCAYCYLNAKKSGTVGNVRCIAELTADENVVWAKPLCREGDKAIGPADGLPTWICDLFVTGDSAQKALDYLHKLEAELPVTIE